MTDVPADVPTVAAPRVELSAFTETDIPAVADILAEPEVCRTITANASTPERCRETATRRIGRHNSAWTTLGYGVWAVRSRSAAIAEPGTVIGWCGFAEPDIGDAPVILYGLAPAYWGHGITLEAARAATDWLFSETAEPGVSAIIFGRLNPAPVVVSKKLGMTRRGTMGMADFFSSRDLARDVIDYEIWRLRHGMSSDLEALAFQAPFKGGQISTLGVVDPAETERAFCEAALERPDYAAIDRSSLTERVRDAYRQGMVEPDLDWYHMARPA